MAYSRKKTFRKNSRKGSKRKTYTRKVTKPLKMAIRREIARNVENKQSQYYNYDTRLYIPGNANFPNDNIFPVGVDPGSLVISQGTGQGQRIGNEIKTKKLMFKGTIHPLPYDATFNANPRPLQVKMYIFYQKDTPTAVPNPMAGPGFFQNGSVTKGFQNDLVDMWSPVNTDAYRILTTRTFKLGFADYSGTVQNASVRDGYQSFTNNEFRLNANFSVDLTKYYPQRVKFNDNTTVPTTRGLFCMFQYVDAGGGVLPTTAYMCNVQYMLDYQYEDA